MVDIVVRKINDVHMKVTASIGVKEKIADAFAFHPPNYQFTPKYKMGIWDGYIRLYNVYTEAMYCGLLRDLIKFAKRYEYEIQIDKELADFEKIDNESIEEWINKELIPTNGEGEALVARDYQLDSITKAIKFKRLLLNSATSSGKSFVIYSIAQWLLQHEKAESILIIVPTLTLIHQMYGDFEEYSQNIDFDVEEWVHKIYAEQDKYTDKPIIISTWQSIHKMPPEYFTQFDCILGDEAHEYEAPSLVKIMSMTNQCKYKIGMTGSLKDAESSIMTLTGLFGPVINVISAKEMGDRGFGTKIHITGIMLEYTEAERKQLNADQRALRKQLKAANRPSGSAEYAQESDFLINHTRRNNFVKNLAVSRKENTLVLFKNIDHGKHLHKIISDAVDEDRPVYLVYGKVKGTVRDEIRALTEKASNAIIVASYATFSTGINIKNLHHLILGFPMKSKTKIIQALGRMMRLYKLKYMAYVYDVADNLQWKTSKNFAMKQFLERLKIYRNEGHKYKIKKVYLK